MPINLLEDEMPQQEKKKSSPINLLADEIDEMPKKSLIDSVKDKALSGVKFNEAMLPSFLAGLTGNKTAKRAAENIGTQIAGEGTLAPMAGEGLAGAATYLPFGEAAGAKLIPQLLAGAAHGAVTADPEQKNAFGYLPKGRAGSALTESLINAMTHGAAKTFESLRPSKMFRGELPPEELKANTQAAEGTTTGLGDIVQSPALKQTLENEISDMPFSNAKKTMQKTATQIQGKANDIAESLNLGKSSNFDLQQGLKEAANEAKNEKNAKFNQVNEEADKLGVKVGRENFSKIAERELSEIKASPELQEELPKDFIASLERYASNKEGNTLKRTDIFRGILGDKANEYFRAGKDKLAGVMSSLKEGLVADREAAIADSGHPTLKNMNDEAHKFYKENYAPFKNPDIQKFTRQGGDADLLLPHFLRKGQNDRSVLLSRLTERLKSGSNQDLPAQLYLSKAIEDGKVNPKKLATLYDSLGENQREVLIPDQSLRKKLENYSKLVHLNSEPLDLMRNPKTGFRGVQSTVHTLLGLGGYAAGGPLGIGGPLGAAAGLVAPGLAMRPVVKALTSPKIRESLVKSMIENKPKFTNKTRGGQTLGQALKAALEGNQ